MSEIKKITSSGQFTQVLQSDGLVVVHFFADWAPQCDQVSDVMNELANLPELKTSNVTFWICPAEDLSDVSLKYKIEAVPTVLLFKNKEIVDRIEGANVVTLTAKVKKHSLCSDTSPLKAAEPLEERLKKLINKHNIMVFMKGNRDTPRCGFSKTLIGIMNDTGIQYETFDILNDEEVRQGLKTFSNWPTYPQVYVKGELIGGLDIIKEMLAAGELIPALQA